MLKRLNVFVLVVFLLSQTIIGPISSTVGFVSAAGDDHGEGANEIDKTALTELLEKVEKENYEEENYEADSFKSFVEAITAGEGVVENADAIEEDVKEAVSEIEKTIDALQKATSPKEEEGDTEEAATEESTEPETPEEDDSEVLEEEKEEDAQKVKPSATTPAPLNGYEDEILLTDKDHLKQFEFTVNGQSFNEDTKISNGDPFELRIELKDLNFDDLNFGPGTVLKYPLPEGFSNHFTYQDTLGSLSGYGDVKIVDDHVEITLNDNVLDGSGTPHNIENGKFNIKGNLSNDNDDWNKDIAMPGGEKFTVNFKPKQGNGETIKKENGKPNKNGQKSNEIEWKVTVNTNLANTTDNPVFKDVLSSDKGKDHSHKYDTGS